MFKAWLFGVGILFIVAEFSIWLKQFMLPFPVYILAGAFLAIASNYDSGLITLFRQQDTATSNQAMAQTATLIEQTEALTANNLNQLEASSLNQDKS